MPLKVFLVVMQFFQQSHQQVAGPKSQPGVPEVADIMEVELVEQETLLRQIPIKVLLVEMEAR